MQVSDEKLATALRRYASLAAVVLEDPERWLGVDDGEQAEDGASDTDPGSTGGERLSLARRAVRTAARAARGEVAPGSAQWPQLTAAQRSDWWVRRIGVVAGFAAATPRYAGALADRLPLQAGLGASAAGLAVCAVAREHGRTDPDEWVPLLAAVLFDRTLPAGPPRSSTDGETDEDRPAQEPDGTVRRAARTLWRLARTFSAISSLFDERPRGSLLARGVAKVPVIGIAGGWFDERGAIRKAADQTAALLR